MPCHTTMMPKPPSSLHQEWLVKSSLVSPGRSRVTPSRGNQAGSQKTIFIPVTCHVTVLQAHAGEGGQGWGNRRVCPLIPTAGRPYITSNLRYNLRLLLMPTNDSQCNYSHPPPLWSTSAPADLSCSIQPRERHKHAHTRTHTR